MTSRTQPAKTAGTANQWSRRELLMTSAAGAILLADARGVRAMSNSSPDASNKPGEIPETLPDLSPAKWIWFPSQRCLQNTFVLFRRVVELDAEPRRATGWITADSRYLLHANGQRVQFGPPPCDPRFLEVDPVDLTGCLRKGTNVLAATVLFYGQGDGTWPCGKPGFLFRLEIETADGRKQIIASDTGWQCNIPRCWPPGQYKRSYVRALQEVFDARVYPHGWMSAEYTAGGDWTAAMEISLPADKPPICSWYENYLYGFQGSLDQCELRPRPIPLLDEHLVPVGKLNSSYYLRWRRPVEEYFDFVTPDACEKVDEPCATAANENEWDVRLDDERGASLVFEFDEQIVGWPRFVIDAPAGTIVEMLVHEAHAEDGPPLLNTHFHSWTRFICREGINEFETYDYESLRWLQLHIRGSAGQVRISRVAVRRRMFPWPAQPAVSVAEPALQRLMDASVNTLHNCAQDQCVDGMARERQQYSGDCGHQLHAIHLAFGERRLPARFLTTYSQGLTVDGYFLDCWPAFDRLARMMSRSVELSSWGPILDHGVGFNFDGWYHYMYTGRREDLAEPYPRLCRFVQYLRSIRSTDGLLPVENIGIPMVWIDHQGYTRQRHKQLAFNLYASGMLRHAHANLNRLFGDEPAARAAEKLSDELLDASIGRFWSEKHQCFVNNLPWLDEEEKPRYCDRSLATAVLFDQNPNGQAEAAINLLATTPPEMGLSYPANAGWRLWALAKAGRIDVVLDDLRHRWATMDSVILNNTLQEDWEARPDSGQQWSHCAVVPLYILFMDIAGIRPTSPGFERCRIKPQLGDLEHLDLAARTVRGPIRLAAKGPSGRRVVTIALPPGCQGELIVHPDEKLSLEPASRKAHGQGRYILPAGTTTEVTLAKT